ncbi:imidazole glycerol phosphate synthase subunit HisH [Bradyrhizobium sp. HKCCYLS2038]|uniref:imidazole glycerol phosphate synthase subunit HisH n=1 Tax=unclassified Bradyrhizobium TaxID=2631580 RepID=UPI003EBBC745
MTITVVDMGISNLASVLQAFRQIGAPPVQFATSDNIERATAIILPGVGAFGDGMSSLVSKGFVEPLRRAVRAGVPTLGICLGMQLLADSSEEFGHHDGLGLIEGQVKRLESDDRDYRIPNIGWCDVVSEGSSVLFPTADQRCFYHIHSYHMVPLDSDVVTGTIAFAGQRCVVAIEKGNLFGVQFHPEKSQHDGLEVLANFFAAIPRMRKG